MLTADLDALLLAVSVDGLTLGLVALLLDLRALLLRQLARRLGEATARTRVGRGVRRSNTHKHTQAALQSRFQKK